ncbi:MAG TPA: hypothetical protein VLZ10_19515 [Thermodesulfobacteriota bacterium]|nr:hypothetical protein [Thermodesulfobacteriota bacterium]
MLRQIPLRADNPPKPWHLHTEVIQRPWAQAGILQRYHGLCQWGSMKKAGYTAAVVGVSSTSRQQAKGGTSHGSKGRIKAYPQNQD